MKVKKKEMFRLVNDDFSTVKMTGRILLCDSDEEEEEEMLDGSCDVHFAELFCNKLCRRECNQSLGTISRCVEGF